MLQLRGLLEAIAETKKATRNEMLSYEADAVNSVKEYIKKRWIYLMDTGKYLNTHSDEYETESHNYIKEFIRDSGALEGANQDENSVLKSLVTDKWTGFTKVKNTKYSPGKEPLITEGSNCYLNIFHQPDITAIKPTAKELVIVESYFDFIAPDREDRTNLECWLAQAVLMPEQRNKFALIMYGESQGTGKGTMQQLLSRQMGSHNSFKPADSAEWVKGKFKSDLLNKNLLVLDELYHEGKSIADKMKPFITENMLEVEPKGRQLVRMENHLNVIASSNNLQPLWIDEGDRRWFCLRVEWINSKEDGKHADNIEQHQKVVGFAQWLNEEPRADGVIRWWLENTDLSEYSYRTNPPMNEFKQALAEGSTSIAEDEFEETIVNVDCLIIKKSELFNTAQLSGKVTPSRQRQWLESRGFIKLNSTNKSGVSIQGTRSLDWWITPKGFEYGLREDMTGSQVGNLLLTYASDHNRHDSEKVIH